MPQPREPKPLTLRSLNPSLRSSVTRSIVPDVKLLYEQRGLPTEFPNVCDYFGVLVTPSETVMASVQAQKSAGRIWVDRLAVVGSLEGRGIGAALLGHAVTTLAETQKDVVELSPTESAQGFYAGLGFARWEEACVPGIQDIWVTDRAVLDGVLAQRATAGRLPNLQTLTI